MSGQLLVWVLGIAVAGGFGGVVIAVVLVGKFGWWTDRVAKSYKRMKDAAEKT